MNPLRTISHEAAAAAAESFRVAWQHGLPLSIRALHRQTRVPEARLRAWALHLGLSAVQGRAYKGWTPSAPGIRQKATGRA